MKKRNTTEVTATNAITEEEIRYLYFFPQSTSKRSEATFRPQNAAALYDDLY